MNGRQKFAIFTGVFGVYLLAHSLLAGYGTYSANEALQTPEVMVDRFVPELRDAYPTLIASFAALTTLGALSLVACAGFIQSRRWARPLWFATSAAAVACVAAAAFVLGVAWTHWLCELLAVGLSCWYVAHLRE